MIPNALRADILKRAPTIDPRHAYAYLLLADFRFSEVTRAKLTREIRIAIDCVNADRAAAERLALTYGL